MQELVNHLKEKAGITEDQAVKAVEAVKDFVIEPIGKIVFVVTGSLFFKSLKPNTLE